MTAVPTQGFLGFVKVGTSASPTNKVAGVSDISLPFAAAEYDVSNMDVANNGWQQYIPGLKGAKNALKVWYDPTDTNGQLVLQNAWVNGTLLYFIVSINGTNTATFTAYVSDMSQHGPVNNANEATYTLQMTGSVTFA
ncbi:MAG TPA: phage tail tube protein [Ktedonobacteraceae bacterium]|nr:phage tail tube protein [Ktedonobacteraceae bacterium]